MNLNAFFRRLFGASSSAPSPADDLELADAVHFDHIVIHAIRQLTKAPLRRLEAQRSFIGPGNEVMTENFRPNALQFKAGHHEAGSIIQRLEAALRGKGYIVFLSEQNFGHIPDVVAILKSTDQFDILRCKGTDGLNYGIDNESLITTLKTWHSETPFDIRGADCDWLEARFRQAPADWKVMAEKVYGFCPDVVDQGTGSVEALATEMRDTGMLYLWWD